MSQGKPISCDIFCVVVDNYGDIGVSWRLARQLAGEYGVVVRLWVDDLASFRKLTRQIDASLPVQHLHGVEIRLWGMPFAEVKPAQIVIEAFACELPEGYVEAMAKQAHKPFWVNLEYLSAEAWVEGCHGLPSPHARLPLTKYFFFPGFSGRTGGLLLESDLFSRRDKFLADRVLQDNYWEKLGVSPRLPEETRVSLFCYETPAVAALLTVWSSGTRMTTCLIPEGRILPQVAVFFGRTELSAGDVLQQGNLRVHVLQLVEQDEYDKLLWACDVNFVRGEDSFVRAQWAAKPFVWHIYPQQDGVHMKKLDAMLDLYCKKLQPQCAQAVKTLWHRWNEGVATEFSGTNISAKHWNDFLLHQPVLLQYADIWASKLAANNLALNLLDFSRKVGRIAPFEI
jgi:uncharacterized repeat protein (TIGR03837 family)